MKKSIISVAVCIALLLCGVSAYAAPAKRFSDVTNETKWYYDFVYDAYDAGLMNGMSDSEFAPNKKLSRAMFVQILANMEGIDTSDRNVKTQFTDVPAGKWFTPAVQWAAENGIVNGTSATEFSPNANVQRQQICAMLLRYAKSIGITLEKKLSKAYFEDDASISGYATDAVYACQQAGIVSGMTPVKFDPKGDATRAQIAKIISVFYDEYSYANRAHQYLWRWLKENGEASGDYVHYYYDIDEVSFGINADPNGYVYLTESMYYDNYFFYFQMYVDDKDYQYRCYCAMTSKDDTSDVICESSCVVNARTVKESSALEYTEYNGDEGVRGSFLEYMRTSRTDVINLLDSALASDVGGITIEDFGFRSWK